VRALAAPAVPPTRGFFDECMMGDGVQFSLGFMKHCPAWPFGSAGSSGAPGMGGSLGIADPEAGIGYAYVTSRVGTSVTADPRDLAPREAVYSVVPDAGPPGG
jgi:CubicO group peptidase (beta-lactamase class C family)